MPPSDGEHYSIVVRNGDLARRLGKKRAHDGAQSERTNARLIRLLPCGCFGWQKMDRLAKSASVTGKHSNGGLDGRERAQCLKSE